MEEDDGLFVRVAGNLSHNQMRQAGASHLQMATYSSSAFHSQNSLLPQLTATRKSLPT